MNLHGQALEVQNGSMQWARIHTMIGLNNRQLFRKANTCAKTVSNDVRLRRIGGS